MSEASAPPSEEITDLVAAVTISDAAPPARPLRPVESGRTGLSDVSAFKPSTYKTPVKRSANETPVKPSTNETPVKPSTDQMTVTPSTNAISVTPSTKEAVIKASTNEAVITPSTDKAVPKSSSIETTRKPSTNEPPFKSTTTETVPKASTAPTIVTPKPSTAAAASVPAPQTPSANHNTGGDIEPGLDALNSAECLPPSIRNEARQTFANIADYVQTELNSTVDDFKLLSRMNEAVASEYHEMSSITSHIKTASQLLNQKYTSLESQFHVIEEMDTNIAALEQAAYALDAYTKRLESKFKLMTNS